MVIKSKTLIDEKWVQAECSFNLNDEVLRDGVIIKSTVESFEQTASEVGEVWAKSYAAMSAIRPEIKIDLAKTEKERVALRRREKAAAEEAVSMNQEEINPK